MTATDANAGAGTSVRPAIDPADFRATLSRFCSGVTVLAGFGEDGAPVGLTCQSFTSLSLTPPLVLVCPGRNSTSWPRIGRSGRFSVNVLAQDQQNVCSALGRSGPDKFTGVRWRRTDRGALVIDGAIAWMD
ncbi:Flavin reductase like domain-containing protein [Thermomonospora echinospora]|uniref:Flavin reductase like domain-containing protein n=1 Tax=Thermomonospora echinospora TaxID=1992 RepID=A0A1H6E7F9_9ACTN|nr:flavin reductase family protein [Thermomonospora echinospora]SEG93650.1 Flavin reductase like domain-containing protein [Thermomonospora echinospora]